MESSVCLAFFVVGFIYTVLYGIAFFLHAIALTHYGGINRGKYFKLHVILAKFKSRSFVISEQSGLFLICRHESDMGYGRFGALKTLWWCVAVLIDQALFFPCMI